MSITLRPVLESDRPRLFDLYSATRQAELAQVPWTPAQKRAFVEMQFAAQAEGYRTTHPNATHEMICVGESAVGRLYLDRQPGCLHILDITVAPESRNSGIGSEVLSGIIAEADRAAKRVSIYVESFNPSLRLFARLGFRTASQEGFLLLLEHPHVAGEP
uniref:GCN5-related N-acetyltransferase n=1 Tax=Solibacter usitatus (strain Ellin6076) TaxID=234267 RepID=Q02CQ6_SOLUE